MKKKNLTGLVLASVLAVAACSEKEVVTGVEAPDSSKIVNAPEAADGQTILVHVTRSAAGTDAVNSIAEAVGAVSIDRVFTPQPGMEVEEARFGLDRWYILSFGKDIDLEKAAGVLSRMGSVETVQYNAEVVPIIERGAASWRPDVATRGVDAASAASFNDPGLASQWHYISKENGKPLATSVAGADINVIDVWKLTAGDPDIIVAVVDEGVAYDHPDLAANMWHNPKETADGRDDDGNGYVDDIYGYNFVKNSGQITWNEVKGSDGDLGHGTHVAGTVSAVNNNGTGVCGIAGDTGHNDGVKIMSCQIFAGGVSSAEAQTAKAIKYAADNGASILQCSWGYQSGAFTNDNSYINSKVYNNSLIADALKYFESADRSKLGFSNPINGGIAIFAAGNDGRGYGSYPGALADIIAVTSFASDNKPTGYTNYGPGCNIAAPGGEYDFTKDIYNPAIEGCILSTMPVGVKYEDYDGSGYGYMQGTSMACPHVSGVAALGLSYMKKLGITCTPEEFKAMLLTSVNDMEKYCVGTKKTYSYSDGRYGNMSLSKFRGKMGTGSIDAWKLMMQIEGTPCLMASVGSEQVLSLESIFGGSYASLKYTGIEFSAEDKAALGLREDPYIKLGRLILTPMRTGNAKITIKAIAGGNVVGGGNNIGGKEISKTVSVVARGVHSDNGGWL